MEEVGELNDREDKAREEPDEREKRDEERGEFVCRLNARRRARLAKG